MSNLKERCPVATDFGAREPKERIIRKGLMSFGFDVKEIFTPATEKEIEEYRRKYADWLDPQTADRSMPAVVDDPVANGARPAAAAATSASSMSPCGGECRVGRTLLRGGPSSPARGADPRAPPASPDCHQQTIDVGRRAATAHCHTQRRTGGWRRSRIPQVDLACSSLSTALCGRKPQQQHQHHLSTKKNSRTWNRRRRPAGGASGSSDRGGADRRRWVGAPSRARGLSASLVNVVNC